MTGCFHGGAVLSLADRLGIAAADIIDLSTGISPHAYPLPDFTADDWAQLPQKETVMAVYAAAATYYGAETPDHVSLFSGTQHFLQLFPWRFREKQAVAVVGPTYEEHAFCWAQAGHDVTQVPTLEAALACEASVVVVVNPNNPTGRLYDQAILKQAQEIMAAKGGLLIVDEAFMDLTPTQSMSGAVGAGHLIVLRSFGKFFGLAGVRIGCVLTDSEKTQAFRMMGGPWVLHGPALRLATQAFNDQAWQEEARRQLKKQRIAFDTVLAACGILVEGGCDLFRWCHVETGAAFFEQAAAQGVLVRAFDHSPAHVRLGLPQGDEALAEIAQQLQI